MRGDTMSEGENKTTPPRPGEARLRWEKPLGVVGGYHDDPGPDFVDVEGEADKEATRLERGGTWPK